MGGSFLLLVVGVASGVIAGVILWTLEPVRRSIRNLMARIGALRLNDAALSELARQSMYHLWRLFPPDDPVRLLRDIRSLDFRDGVEHKLEFRGGRFKSVWHIAIVARSCVAEIMLLPAAWWSFNPVLVAGTLEVVGSLALLVGGTHLYGLSFTAVEIILVAAMITGVFGFHKRKPKWLGVSAFLVLGQAIFVGLTSPIDLDNLTDFVASLAWLLGIALCMDSFGKAPRSDKSAVLQFAAHILAAGMVSDAISCLLDLPRLAATLHVGHAQDAITWFNAGPIPGLILLTWVLSTGRFRGGRRWLGSMARNLG